MDNQSQISHSSFANSIRNAPRKVVINGDEIVAEYFTKFVTYNSKIQLFTPNEIKTKVQGDKKAVVRIMFIKDYSLDALLLNNIQINNFQANQLQANNQKQDTQITPEQGGPLQDLVVLTKEILTNTNQLIANSDQLVTNTNQLINCSCGQGNFLNQILTINTLQSMDPRQDIIFVLQAFNQRNNYDQNGMQTQIIGYALWNQSTLRHELDSQYFECDSLYPITLQIFKINRTTNQMEIYQLPQDGKSYIYCDIETSYDFV